MTPPGTIVTHPTNANHHTQIALVAYFRNRLVRMMSSRCSIESMKAWGRVLMENGYKLPSHPMEKKPESMGKAASTESQLVLENPPELAPDDVAGPEFSDRCVKSAMANTPVEGTSIPEVSETEEEYVEILPALNLNWEVPALIRRLLNLPARDPKQRVAIWICLSPYEKALKAPGKNEAAIRKITMGRKGKPYAFVTMNNFLDGKTVIENLNEKLQQGCVFWLIVKWADDETTTYT
ncbi:hypothetical protein RvY_11630 [Ramazzottius varieornatus]|uniref:Uncharacterized protein n=1 Tax=Ramazzottius varieornatus TaxID=947166 RepID=A0A1D1VJ60_RAMVA|nr:hypothetical protein RvY_11630 [Ramazzottius varieornatus]